MGYLDNEIIQIEAILTRKGKELLSKNNGTFLISKFALSDDGVDYNLYNENTTDELKGLLIENSPVLEPVADETEVMKNKLITLPIGTTRMPMLSIGQTSIVLNASQHHIITPTIVNFSNANDVFGYTATIDDNSVAELIPYSSLTIGTTNISTDTNSYYSSESKTVIGQQFEIIGRNLLEDKNTKIIIQGNETGGQVEIALTVKKITQNI